MTRRLVASVLLVAVLLSGAAGCKSKSVENEQTGVPTGTPVATSSVEPTAKPVDTSAIEKELTAIEKELEAISMPGDSDFDAIEGDLP